MYERLYKISFVFVLTVVGISSSFDNRFSDDEYDDSLWTFSRNFRNEHDIDIDEDQRSNVPEYIDIKMPDVSPQKHDSYFCTAAKMPEDDAYIVGYKPHAKKETAHHMLMFGCDEVDESELKGANNCNEMGGICKGRLNKIMYAWAMDAKELVLPEDVGFHVGGSSNIKYIVLQVHYANVEKFKKYHSTDSSGVVLHLQAERPRKFAGIYLVAAGGPPIPPREKEFDMNMACKYTMGPEMHPFAFRVHTHRLGYVVTGYRVRNGKWHLIGKGDPQQPQAFNHVDSEDSLLPGDTLAARCTYNSLKRDHTTYIGATGADEMCNFYMMYWYDPAEGLNTDACVFASFQSSDYPPDTSVPLPPKKKMDMKRDIEEFEDVGDSVLTGEDKDSWK